MIHPSVYVADEYKIYNLVITESIVDPNIYNGTQYYIKKKVAKTCIPNEIQTTLN